MDDLSDVLAVVEGDRSLPVSMVDISTSGTAVVASAPLGDVNGSFTVELHSSGPPRRIHLPCRIRYIIGESAAGSPQPNWLHGARFDGLSAEAQSFVDRYVSEHAAGQP